MNQLHSDALIEIINFVLFGMELKQSAYEQIRADEWESILRMVSSQALLPVFMEGLSRLPHECRPERPCWLKFLGLAEKQRRGYHVRLKTMQQLSALFHDKGLDILYIKGATLARMYPQPELRVCGDIDYYMFGKSEESIRVLAEAGVQTHEYFHHHTQAEANGILLENHYDFIDRVNHRCNEELDDCLKSLAEKEGHTNPFMFEGSYAMTPTMNALFLMRHMSAHFVSETVTLRQLYDWALFLRNQSEEVDWKLVLEKYRVSGMLTFARQIQYIVNERLGVPTDGSPITPLNDALSERIWDSIINPLPANPYEKNSIKYFRFELKTFRENRWKHQLVYPGESYIKLAFIYARSQVKKKLHLLSH